MIIDFNDQRTWPADVLQYLEQNHNLFLAWENSPGSISGQQYDKALRDLRAVLNQHRLHGYHCTRLTRAEINHIVSDGMQLPNAAMLRARVQAVQDDGLIEASIAKRLAEENQADDSNRAQRICFCSNRAQRICFCSKRAQRICFCFFPPCLAGESGIRSLLGLWGGEALYNTHERDRVTGPVLANLGIPCLVEADIAISSLRGTFLDVKAARQFLVWRGFQSSERWLHEDSTTRDVPAANIRRVIEFRISAP